MRSQKRPTTAKHKHVMRCANCKHEHELDCSCASGPTLFEKRGCPKCTGGGAKR